MSNGNAGVVRGDVPIPKEYSHPLEKEEKEVSVDGAPHQQRASYRGAPKKHENARHFMMIQSGQTLRWKQDSNGVWGRELINSDEAHELNAMGA